MTWAAVDSPLGPLIVEETGGTLSAICIGGAYGAMRNSECDHPTATGLLQEAAAQLHAYFAGTATKFDLPLAPAGSPFQEHMRAAMLDIPYGQTRSYGDLARTLGVGPRAVGQGCGRNPLPILVPCHRVLAAGGGIGGYSAGDGPATKRMLLALEQPLFRLRPPGIA